MEDRTIHHIDNLLTFWFGTLDAHGLADAEHRKRWFVSSAQWDAQIRQQFEPTTQAAAAGALSAWEASAPGRLALILACDQFPRNMYRGTAAAFAYDDIAQRLCLEGIDLGQDTALPGDMRAFFYMPLMHAEDLDLQRRCVNYLENFVHSSPGRGAEHLTERLSGYVENAHEHMAIIAQFGRFPHRNRILGRPDTAQEQRYLAEATGSFGQTPAAPPAGDDRHRGD